MVLQVGQASPLVLNKARTLSTAEMLEAWVRPYSMRDKSLPIFSTVTVELAVSTMI